MKLIKLIFVGIIIPKFEIEHMSKTISINAFRINNSSYSSSFFFKKYFLK